MSHLLVSHDIGKFPTRHPLEKVLLPAELVACSDRSSDEHIWWAERHGQSLYLRARLYITQAFLERELKSRRRRLIWYLDTVRSERTTWPGTKQCKKSNIAGLLDHLSCNFPLGPSVIPIAKTLDLELEGRHLGVSDSVRRYEHAARILRRLFDRTEGHITSTTLVPLPLEQAWYYVHAHFAREELVQLPGYDAYEVAAAVIAGYTEMPEQIHVLPHSADTLSISRAMQFQELDEEHIGYVEREWTRSMQASNNLEVLELKTKQHQQILQALAHQIRAKGFCPTYNRYVDLRIEREDDEVFFEIKTANPNNLWEQVRCAVGQLLEYRFRYARQNGEKPIRLAAVVEENAPFGQYELVREFLTELSIALVLWKQKRSQFEGLAGLLNCSARCSSSDRTTL